MTNEPNEVMNFEQLMQKYIKNTGKIPQFDFKSPLKEISPMEPLPFNNDNYQNDIIYNNNTNVQTLSPNYHQNFYDNNNDNKFITPSKPINKDIEDINSFINSSKKGKKH